MNTIGIFGVGNIGSLLTKYLSQNDNNNLFYYNRSKKEEIRIRFQKSVSTIPIELESKFNQKLDWLIISIKTHQIDIAKTQIDKLIGPNTKLAIFRNGINLHDDYIEFTIEENILETIIDCPTQKNTEAEIIQLSKPKIILTNQPLAYNFAKLFNKTDIDFSFVENFEIEQWKKLIQSSSLGSIQAKYRKPCSIFNDPKIMEEYRALLKEGIAVANCIGIELGNNFYVESIRKVNQYPETKGSSMLTDIMSGRKLELEAKIGVIVKVGLENNIPIPASERIYKTLSDLNSNLLL